MKDITLFVSDIYDEFNDEMMLDLREANPEIDDYTLSSIAVDVLEEDLGIYREEFDNVPGDFVVIGTSRRWNGSTDGFSPYFDTTLGEMIVKLGHGFVDSESYTTLTLTDDGELSMTEAHHDGTNLYVLRKVKDGVSCDDIEEFGDNLNGNLSELYAMTEPVGVIIRKRYGIDDEEAV